jgi:hypothetical protein
MMRACSPCLVTRLLFAVRFPLRFGGPPLYPFFLSRGFELKFNFFNYCVGTGTGGERSLVEQGR